mgnify:FL=1
MKKFYLSTYHFLFLIISILSWVYLLGFDYIKPTNITWLNSGDLSTYQLGWEYFRDDKWRFPIGLNPNYGIYSDSNIIYSDSIPIFAIFFKLFNFLLPEKFQYFSIWILLCIYLQILFSYKIIYIGTGNKLFSFLGSLFFLTASIFIHRSGIHLSLLGQWLILCGIYIEISENGKKDFLRLIILLLSLLVHFYFFLMLIILIFFQDFYKVFFLRKSFTKIVKKLIFTIIVSIALMYTVGYFSINLDDGLGWGYGYYNFNLNSFINPSGQNNIGSFSWSNFLTKQNYQNQEIEGFSYLGFSGIIFFVFFLYNISKGKFNIFFQNLNWIIIILPFLLISMSNNINFGSMNIVSIDLNKFVYAFFSIFRASGRMIWPVYYIIFIIGIIFIFKNFKSKSILVLLTLLVLQIGDIYSGIKNYSFGSQYSKFQEDKKNPFWSGLSKQFNEILLIESKNQSSIFNELSGYLIEENFIKTDLVNLARVNREKTTFAKYNLIQDFNKKNLSIFNKKIFLTKNKNIALYLKNLFQDKIYIYFQDNIWIITNDRIRGYEQYDISLDIIFELNVKDNFTIDLSDNFLIPSIGWEIQNKGQGLVSQGYTSSLLLKIKGISCEKKNKIKFHIEKYYRDLENNIKFSLNDGNYNIVNFDTNNPGSLILDLDCNASNIYNFTFRIDNPISLYDLKQGLNREKKSIILKSISII